MAVKIRFLIIAAIICALCAVLSMRIASNPVGTTIGDDVSVAVQTTLFVTIPLFLVSIAFLIWAAIVAGVRQQQRKVQEAASSKASNTQR